MQTFIFDFDYTLYNQQGNGHYLAMIYTHALQRMGIEDPQKKIQRYIRKHDPRIPGYYCQLIFDIHKEYSVEVTPEDVDFSLGKVKSLTTQGIQKIIDELHEGGHRLFIVGGAALGTHIIPPVVETYNIPRQNIYSGAFKGLHGEAMEEALNGPFRYVNAADPDFPTPISDKKSVLINHLKSADILEGPITLIGDGTNDLEAFTEGAVDTFIGFGVHRKVDEVRAGTPYFVEDIDAFGTMIREFMSR